MIKKNKRLTTVSIQKYSNNHFEFKICFEYKQENSKVTIIKKGGSK